MAEWQSLEELVKDLGLSTDPHQPAKIEKAIRRKVSLLHPDKNGGKFLSDADREEYNKWCEALEFVRGKRDIDKALTIRPADLQDLIETLRGLPAKLAKPEPDPEALRNSCRVDLASDRKARFSARRRTSGVFAALTGVLFAFSEGLKENLIFGPLFTSPITRGVLVLVVLFLFSCGMWLVDQFAEGREKAMMDDLLSETHREEVVRYALPPQHPYVPEDLDDNVQVQFTIGNIVDGLSSVQDYRLKSRSIIRGRHLWWKLRIPEITLGELNQAALEKIAKVIVAELEAQGVIRKASDKHVGQHYSIAQSILKEICNWY